MLRKRRIVLAFLAVAATAAWSWAATVYQIQTKLGNAGGTLKVANKPVQNIVGSTVFNNFTTSAAVPVTVTANTGYTIASVTKSGTTVNTPVSPYTVNFVKSAGTGQSLVATFAVMKSTITTSVTTNADDSAGLVTPTTSTVNYGANATLTATPSLKNGYVGAITVNGIPFSFTPAAGPIAINLTNVTANQAVAVTFRTVTVNAGADQVGAVGNTVTLNGSATGNGTLAWTQLSGPSVVLSGAGTTAPSFTPNVAGTYSFQLADLVAGTTLASSIVQVTVVSSMTDFMRSSCNGCHSPNSAVPSTAFGLWSSSTHKTVSVTCAFCHGAPGGEMPPPLLTSANNCEVCHSGPSGAPASNFRRSSHWTNQMNNFTNLSAARTYLLAVEGPSGADVPPQGDWATDCSISCHFKQAPGKDACLACHNQHRPETGLPTDLTAANTIFFAYSSVPSAGTVPGIAADGITPTVESLQYGYWRHDTGCVKCHHQGNGEGNAPSLYDNSDFPTTPHFDITSDNSGVSFMNAGQTCANCHGHNNSINSDYGKSGHGDVTAAAWANPWCTRCHTTTGFINYSSFHTSYDNYAMKKEVLGCNGCHTSPDMTYSAFGNLTSINGVVGSIRKIAPYPATYSAYGGPDVTFQFPDTGPSNVCIPCHSGRKSGRNIHVLTEDMTNSYDKDPHYLAAAGILYQSTGYEFAGASYTKPAYFAHDQIGINHFAEQGKRETGIVGPCAACHYVGPDGTGPGHTLHVFNHDPVSNAVTGVKATICANCHSGQYVMDAAAANTEIAGFQASLGALQALLQTKGVYWNKPQLFYTDATYTTGLGDWTFGTLDNSIGKNNMGASFNLRALTMEPGAYAHNRIYTKRLIFDSIDWLQNGAMTETINIGAIPSGGADGHGGMTPVFDATAAASYLGATRP